MGIKKIVITGGPGTGKTSIIKELLRRDFVCLEEISRQVILDAQKQGIEQLFLTKPLLFSDMLLEGRKKQFFEADAYTCKLTFLDRGIPDVVAYMDYLGTNYPERFVEACKNYSYDHVFILAPWQQIYVSDNERYENFDQAVKIHDHLVNAYTEYGYDLHDVPFGSVESRADFILNIVDNL
ncbi:AAA family ATPase [Pontimicrobium aquaticum]|uniref:ATPase n=1 Tax=Pontimicrobium aquaticum TaxID=2565367 RepID=A0A4U0EZP3_9FLAO|nr:ATP-binding protein [Pontimicrobium aquaticum]TJY35852.1 ATPase [Pontimicrobium aquaticum]